jgi:hypothetical protein
LTNFSGRFCAKIKETRLLVGCEEMANNRDGHSSVINYETRAVNFVQIEKVKKFIQTCKKCKKFAKNWKILFEFAKNWKNLFEFAKN